MKKFSKQTNSPVGEEKKVERSLSEEDILKSKIMGLMDDFLRVQTYGPVTRYQVAGTMKVAGKELFAEALVDFLKNWDSKREIKVLEELKLQILDWEVIDQKIDQIKIKGSKKFEDKNFFKELVERWDGDREIILEKVKLGLDKLSREEIESRILTLEGLDGKFEDIYRDILKIYRGVMNQD